jgi:antitoxin YefM
MLKFIVSAFRKSIKDLVASTARKARQLVVGIDLKASKVVRSSRKHMVMSTTQLELSSEINKKRLDAAIAKFLKTDSF